MQAWMIQEAGGPDVLRLSDTVTPEPGPGEVRVRVEAVGINRADLLQRMGGYPPPPGVDPRIPGLEYAGVVDAVGPRTQLREVGARVMGIVGGGAYADYLTVHERETLSVPRGLDAVQAAAIPEDFLTAYRALFLEGRLEPGEWCLIRAATSGVGIAAAQLAHALGAFSIGTSRSAERLERVLALGLDAGHVDGEGSLPEQVRDVSGNGAAVVLDLLGGTHLGDNLASLRAEGTVVLVGLLAGRQAELDLGRFLMRRLTLRAMTMRSLPLERKIELARRFETRLAPLFAQGRLQPVVSHTLPFAEAPEAHRLMESNRHLGKIVLQHD